MIGELVGVIASSFQPVGHALYFKCHGLIPRTKFCHYSDVFILGPEASFGNNVHNPWNAALFAWERQRVDPAKSAFDYPVWSFSSSSSSSLLFLFVKEREEEDEDDFATRFAVNTPIDRKRRSDEGQAAGKSGPFQPTCRELLR
jgi:hypothetical protein